MDTPSTSGATKGLAASPPSGPLNIAAAGPGAIAANAPAAARPQHKYLIDSIFMRLYRGAPRHPSRPYYRSMTIFSGSSGSTLTGITAPGRNCGTIARGIMVSKLASYAARKPSSTRTWRFKYG